LPDRRDLWRRAADLDKAHGSHESLDELLAACRRVPSAGKGAMTYVSQAKVGGWGRTCGA
jgi:hypothetical protein